MKENRGRAYYSWAFVVAWMGLIYLMSSQTGDSLHNGAGFLSDLLCALEDIQGKLLGENVDVVTSAAHFFEYAILGVFLVNALSCHTERDRVLFFAVLMASAYGVSDEIHQAFVPNRLCDPVDWAVDTLGAALGAYVFRKYRMRNYL